MRTELEALERRYAVEVQRLKAELERVQYAQALSAASLASTRCSVEHGARDSKQQADEIAPCAASACSAASGASRRKRLPQRSRPAPMKKARVTMCAESGSAEGAGPEDDDLGDAMWGTTSQSEMDEESAHARDMHRNSAPTHKLGPASTRSNCNVQRCSGCGVRGHNVRTCPSTQQPLSLFSSLLEAADAAPSAVDSQAGSERAARLSNVPPDGKSRSPILTSPQQC
jgi:hypothetical protein